MKIVFEEGLEIPRQDRVQQIIAAYRAGMVSLKDVRKELDFEDEWQALVDLVEWACEGRR